MKVLALSLLLGLTKTLLAQQFFHASFQGLGPGPPPAVGHLPNGDMLQAFFTSVGTPTITLVKTDPCDEIIWSKNLNTAKTPSRFVDLVAYQNEIYLAAVLGPQLPDSTLTLIKFTPDGNLVWSKQLTGPLMYWYSFAVNDQGSLFLNGNSLGSSTLANVVVKLNPAGSILWSNSYTQRQVWGVGIPDKNGGFLRLTVTLAYLLDANGQPQWIKNYDSGYQSLVSPLATDDGFVIFSKSTSQIQSQAFKIDLDGNMVWSGPLCSGSVYSDAVLLKSQKILISSSGAGTNFDQTQLIWLDENNGALSNSKWIDPNTQPANLPAVTANDQGDLFLHSQLATATATDVDFLRIKPKLAGTNKCQWQNGNLNTSNEEVTVIGNFAVPQLQAVSFNIQTISASFQTTSEVLLKGCTNVPFPEEMTLGEDTTLCPGEELMLNLEPSITGSYLWNTGHRGESLTVAKPGEYWLMVTPKCGEAFFSDTIQVDFSDELKPEIQADQFKYKLGEKASFALQGKPDTTAFWQSATGDTNHGPYWKLELSQPGQQWVKACYYSLASCLLCDSLAFKVEAPELHLPNAFTPDGDGLNDFFGPPDGALAFYELWVKDRFGKIISYTKNQPWDGEFNGQAARLGVYVFELRYQIYPGQPKQKLRGSFTLIL